MLNPERKRNSKFLKVGCPRCNQIQILYGRSSLKTKCIRCNRLLIKTLGGKVKIKAKVIEVLWK